MHFVYYSNWSLWNTIFIKVNWDSKVIMITHTVYHHDLEKKGHKQNPLQGQQQTFYLCSNELIKFSRGWMIEITPVPVKHMCTHSHTPQTGNNKPRTETSDLNIHHLSVCLWGPFRLKESHKNRFDVNPWLDVGIEGSDIVKNAAVWQKHTPQKNATPGIYANVVT